MTAEETSPATPAPRPSYYSWYVLALLFAVYVMNMADRQILGILAQDIKTDLKLSDSQIGFLAGPAIGFFYAVLGIPMAYVADRVNRVRFVAICLAVWSAMTALGAAAQTHVQLALTRIGVSVAEAGGTPSSASLLADYFPPHRRGRVMAIWSASTTVGIFLGFALGGVVNEAIGWRKTFIVAGVPGIVLAALIMLTLREPKRGATDIKKADPAETTKLSMAQSFTFLWKIEMFRRSVLASAACNFCTFSILAWAATHAVRYYKVGTAEVGTLMGAGIMTTGAVGMVLAGFAGDILGRKGLHRPLWAIALLVALSGLIFAKAFTAPDFRTFGILFVIGYGMLATNSPIGWVIVQESAPPQMRAMAAAIMLLVINILSSVPAPLIIGFLSDRLQPRYGDQSVGMALLLVPVAALIASVLLFRTGLTAKRLGLSSVQAS